MSILKNIRLFNWSVILELYATKGKIFVNPTQKISLFFVLGYRVLLPSATQGFIHIY